MNDRVAIRWCFTQIPSSVSRHPSSSCQAYNLDCQLFTALFLSQSQENASLKAVHLSRSDQRLADVGIQKPGPLPKFGTTLKGDPSCRAPCRISWDLGCTALQQPLCLVLLFSLPDRSVSQDYSPVIILHGSPSFRICFHRTQCRTDDR